MTPATVLVRLPNWLGDVLMARPLLHALRAAWPDARLVAVGPEPLLATLAGDAIVDEGLAWPRERSARRAATARVCERSPDVALVLPGSFSSAWLAWRSGARERVGYRGEGRSPLLTRALPRRPRGERHLSDEFLDLAAPLGVSPVPVPILQPRPEDARAAAELLAAARIQARDAFALVGPRSAYGPAREWFANRFAAAGRGLVERGMRVLVCGTAAEAASCMAIAQSIGTGAVSIAGRTTLPVLVALAARARVALCNDSGLAHVAAATGAATLQIYGSAASGWTAARGPRVRILHRAPVCSPCWRRRCLIGTRCLDAVTVAWVLAETDALLAEAG
jgi:heptosyltransferase-2